MQAIRGMKEYDPTFHMQVSDFLGPQTKVYRGGSFFKAESVHSLRLGDRHFEKAFFRESEFLEKSLVGIGYFKDCDSL